MRALWCDGFIPENYFLDRHPPTISGRAWIGIGKRQEQWAFTLLLPGRVTDQSPITFVNPSQEALRAL